MEKQFVLRPNQSADWRLNLTVASLFALLSGAIAAFFFSQGLWLVLPFCGLEALIFCLFLFWVQRQGDRRQVISLQGSRVEVEEGAIRSRTRHRFDRAWVQLQWRLSDSYKPPRLYLCQQGRVVEIGAFLTQQERSTLAISLRRALADFDEQPSPV